MWALKSLIRLGFTQGRRAIGKIPFLVGRRKTASSFCRRGISQQRSLNNGHVFRLGLAEVVKLRMKSPDRTSVLRLGLPAGKHDLIDLLGTLGGFYEQLSARHLLDHLR